MLPFVIISWHSVITPWYYHLQGCSRRIIVPITKHAPDIAVWAILKDAGLYTDKGKTELITCRDCSVCKSRAKFHSFSRCWIQFAVWLQ